MNNIKKYFYLILLIISIIPVYRMIRPGLWSMSDDMHIFRLQQFDQCLSDGQIPCRYIASGGLGYGYPLFNYYSPLPYFIGEVFHISGFSYIDSIKLVFIVSYLLAGFGMFFLARSFWGTGGGFISAVFFLLAPYHAVNTYVRGSLAELLALSIVPTLFFSSYQYLLRPKRKYFLLIIFSLTGLLLCHNLTALYTLPWLIIFLLLIFRLKVLNFFKPLFLSGLLSAFYTLPVLLEKGLVTVETMTQGYFNYISHFATLSQLFLSRKWGFGASLWGPVDDLSFQLGILHWLLILIIILFLIGKYLKKQILPQSVIIIFFFISFIFFIFLTHNKSTFLWQFFPFMAYFQFPWRFIGPAVFCLSFLSGSIVLFFKTSVLKYLIIFLVGLVFFLNLIYFKEDIWFPNLTDDQKLSESNFIQQSGMGLKDYWPKYGQNFPVSYAPDQPMTGSPPQFKVLSYLKNSHQILSTIDVIVPSTEIIFPAVYFPEWKLTVDGHPSDYQISPELGLLSVNLPPGIHTIKFSFINSFLRNLANLTTLLGVICLLSYIFQHRHHD